MYVWSGLTNNVYPSAVLDVLKGRTVQIDRPDAVDSQTVEVSPGVFRIIDARERLVTSYGRPVNVPFMLAEVLWILAGRKDVEMLSHYNSTIGQFSDDGELFNAAYGYRLRRSFGHDQIEDVIRTLRDDRSSRQAVLVISNPVDDKGWNRHLAENPDDVTALVYSKKQTKDRACNLMSHMLIRDDRLEWLQVLRSNDIIWGTPYNFMQFMHLQEYIARSVGVDVSTYTHVAHSLHMYSHHYEQAAAISPFDLYEHHQFAHAPMEVSDEAMNLVMREELAIRTRGADSWHLDFHTERTVGGYWHTVLCIFASFSAYKAGNDQDALTWLARCLDPVYAASTARFYYQNRWHKDEHRRIVDLMDDYFDVDESVWIKTRA